MQEDVKVTIEGEGLSLTKLTSLQKAGQIISFLGYSTDGSTVLPDNSPRSGVGASLLPTKRLQPKDFILSSNAKTYPQKIAALAMYFQEQLGQNSFTPQEIKVLFKKMGDEPKNFTRDLNSTLELQYVLCIDSTTEQYELTSKGADAYRDGFVGVASKKNTNSKKPSTSKAIREEVKALEATDAMDGYPDYHNLSTKGDKILWLLEYAYKKSVHALTPAEIDFLSVRLRERIESGGFTALNERNIKKSFVKKTIEGFQIQKRGSDHIKSTQV